MLKPVHAFQYGITPRQSDLQRLYMLGKGQPLLINPHLECAMPGRQLKPC